jgi:cysteinyl-tRNA synthetase
MLSLLGLDPFDPAFAAGGDKGMHETVDALVTLALQQRTAARERKDWAAADAVRDQLKQAGVAVEDTPHGPRWTVGSVQ